MRAMPVRYAYLGPEGTFTEAALAEFDPSALAEAMPCASIQAALDAVRAGAAERAIVPIESSVEGAVTATLDELAAGPDLAIQAELLLPVTFALLGREGTGLADIKTVGGHPQAQPQCRRWLAQHLPDAEWLPTSSNAEAARQAADGQIDAALAGAFAAGRYGLAVLAAEVNDVPDAVTRFVVVSLPGPGARLHRRGPDLAGGLPARGPPRRADGAAHRVRGSRHQPHPDRVPADRGRAGQVLLLHRLRGPPRRRPGRRGADGPAPGLRRRQVPRQLPAPRRRAHARSAPEPPTPSSPRRRPGWAACATAGC